MVNNFGLFSVYPIIPSSIPLSSLLPFVDTAYSLISTQSKDYAELGVFLKLLVYNKKIVVYKTFTREVIDIIDLNEFDKIPEGCSWVPPNFVEVKDYLSFVGSLELDEETGEMKLN